MNTEAGQLPAQWSEIILEVIWRYFLERRRPSLEPTAAAALGQAVHAPWPVGCAKRFDRAMIRSERLTLLYEVTLRHEPDFRRFTSNETTTLRGRTASVSLPPP